VRPLRSAAQGPPRGAATIDPPPGVASCTTVAGAGRPIRCRCQCRPPRAPPLHEVAVPWAAVAKGGWPVRLLLPVMAIDGNRTTARPHFLSSPLPPCGARPPTAFIASTLEREACVKGWTGEGARVED
jgi:hypothetical protein